MAMACYRVVPGAIVVTVRLTPRADRDAVDGVGALSDGRPVARVRVRALPDRGAANAALLTLMAKAFGRRKSAVTLVAGATLRLKQVRVAGDPGDLVRVVESWPSPI